MLSLWVALVFLLSLATAKEPCPGGREKCPDYEKLEVFHDIEIRRYDASRWAQIYAYSDEYGFMKEKAYRDLHEYFHGNNYESQRMSLTTPLLFTFDPADPYKEFSRRGQMFLNSRSESGVHIPAPRYPVGIIEMDPAYFYIRKINQTASFRDIWREAHLMMADLDYYRQPMDMSRILLALYDYPKPIEGPTTYKGSNEIWIEKAAFTPGDGHSDQLTAMKMA
ncbi:hypothetical protein BSKO_00632 [Bryopsis sp. KO-2023]|nr:hypothetical protein BSKO_00632 [Bryopsis sp. KO-2023]